MEFLYQFANDERFNGVDILSISSLEVAQGNAPKRNYNSFIDWNENLIELFSIGQAKNMTKLFEFLDGKLKFPMNYVRITNEPLSAEHMRNISMDNASDRSLKILQSIGNATAIKAKMDPKVERFSRQVKHYISKNMANNHEQFIAFNDTIKASKSRRDTLKKIVNLLERKFVITSRIIGRIKFSPNFIGKVHTLCILC